MCLASHISPTQSIVIVAKEGNVIYCGILVMCCFCASYFCKVKGQREAHGKGGRCIFSLPEMIKSVVTFVRKHRCLIKS